VASTAKMLGVIGQMCAEMTEQRAEKSAQRDKLDTVAFVQSSAGALALKTVQHRAKRHSNRRKRNTGFGSHSSTEPVEYNKPWTLPADFHRRGKPSGKSSLGEANNHYIAHTVRGMGALSKGKLRFTKATVEEYENPCYSYGPPYCCKNFVRFQCGVRDVDGRPPFGGPRHHGVGGGDTYHPNLAGWPAWSGLSGPVDRKEIMLPFRINPENKIEFALEKDACDVDPINYQGRTKVCTLEEMGAGYSLDRPDDLGPDGLPRKGIINSGNGHFQMRTRGGVRGATNDGQHGRIMPLYYAHTLDGTDSLCNMARAAIMRCSSGGNRGAYIKSVKHIDYENTHNDKHPLDYTSQEAMRMLRVDAQQSFMVNILPIFGSWRDSVGLEPLVEPLYNPLWHPYYKQRQENENFKPRHLCQCVKPYYIENDSNACKPIRVYDGYTLAGQKCNARVVDYAEIPATYKHEYLCCDKWKEFWQGLMRIKYCDAGDGSEPKVTVQIRVRLVPMKGMIPVTFYPPARALMGSCNSYVKMLALGLKYGGIPFRLELKRAAKAQLEDWTLKARVAAQHAKIALYQNNEKEVKNKMKNRQIQWIMAKSHREEQWRGRWNLNDEEYSVWMNDCCFTSAICFVMTMFLELEFFGGKESQCNTIDLAPSRNKARKAFVDRYGLSRKPYVKGWATMLGAMLPGVRL